VIVCDPGKALRLISFESQIHPIMMFSSGVRLSEEYVFDKAMGMKLHITMFEFKKPAAVCQP
jgi:hypothetical protein